MINKFKNQLTPIIAIIAQPFLSWNPSVLTVLSLLAAVLFFVGMISHAYLLAFIGLVGFLFDAIDGYVARKMEKVTKFGGFLDSTLDRVADFLFITSFAYAGLVSWTLVVLAFGSSFLISYMRSRGELAFGMEKPMREGLMQRGERILFLFIVLMLFLLFPQTILWGQTLVQLAFMLLIALNSITIYQRLSFFYNISRKI